MNWKKGHNRGVLSFQYKLLNKNAPVALGGGGVFQVQRIRLVFISPINHEVYNSNFLRMQKSNFSRGKVLECFKARLK